jgi:hypothetical protein
MRLSAVSRERKICLNSSRALMTMMLLPRPSGSNGALVDSLDELAHESGAGREEYFSAAREKHSPMIAFRSLAADQAYT